MSPLRQDLSKEASVIIWKPPAFIIVAGTFAVFFLGLGAVLVNLLGILPPGDQAGAVMSAAWGISIILADVGYRRSTELSLFDMSQSTVFFVIPTWVVGIPVIVWGQTL